MDSKSHGDHDATKRPREEAKVEDISTTAEPGTNASSNTQAMPAVEGSSMTAASHKRQRSESPYVEDEKLSSSITSETESERPRLQDKRVDISALSFPEQLLSLLGNDNITAIRWSESGKEIEIHEPDLQEEILNKFMFGLKFDTFRRKLNRWGFKRAISNSEDWIVYSNVNFQRDQRDSMKKMRCVPNKKAAEKNRVSAKTVNRPDPNVDLGFFQSQNALSAFNSFLDTEWHHQRNLTAPNPQLNPLLSWTNHGPQLDAVSQNSSSLSGSAGLLPQDLSGMFPHRTLQSLLYDSHHANYPASTASSAGSLLSAQFLEHQATYLRQLQQQSAAENLNRALLMSALDRAVPNQSLPMITGGQQQALPMTGQESISQQLQLQQQLRMLQQQQQLARDNLNAEIQRILQTREDQNKGEKDGL